jgi:hypothetical protein
MAEIRVNATGAVKLYDNDDSHFVGLQAGSVSSNVTFTLPTADGSNGQFMKTDGSGALSFGSVSSAADDISTGDAAVTIATSAGNITVDAQGDDTDIIFKGTDGGADTTFLTIDGSDAGKLLPNNGMDLNGKELILDADADTSITSDTDDQIDIKIAGADDFQFTANTFTVASGSKISGGGALTIDNASGDITIDAAGDILLDADDTDILLRDGGTTFGGFKQVSNGLQISGGTTPSIVADANGHVTMPAQSTFAVQQTGSLSVANGHTLFSTNTTERWDVNSDLSGGTFTAPVTGKYLLSYNMLYEGVSDDSVFEDYIQTSNRSYAMWRNTRAYSSNSSYLYNAITVIADMDANDTAKVIHGGGATATVHHSNQNWPYFQGWLLG